MPAYTLRAADNRKKQIQLVGKDLLKHYGKKKFYTVQQVKNANRRQLIELDVACWSHAFFNSHGDFDAYHAKIGESCDFVGMKRELLDAVTTGPSDASSLFDLDVDFDLSWLEFPDIEWSIFDLLD